MAADQLVQAMRAGDGRTAFDAGMRLVTAYQTLFHEAAQLRFQINFGGPFCQHCEGLTAGPGVAATCFQIRQCTFGNVKEGDATPKQLRVLQNLLDPPKRT
jgi:hypothetical protein